MADDLFAVPLDLQTPQIDPNKDYLAELVGEGKKYADVKALARAAAEKEAMIVTQRRETHELRDALNARMKMEELVTKLASLEKPASPAATPAQVEVTDKSALTPEDIQAQVEATLSLREAENARKRNLINVTETLRNAYGQDFAHVVQQKAQAIGVETSYLNNLAATQPQVLYALLGINQAPAAPFQAPPKTGKNSDSFTPQGKEKTLSDYNKLPLAERLSQKVQIEMHNQAKKLGPDFFK